MSRPTKAEQQQSELTKEALKVASDAYLLMLQMPPTGLRMRNQRVLAQTRDFIAKFSGKDVQRVQEEFEDEAAHLHFESGVVGK